MDDTPNNPEPKKEFNKLDLSQLQSFSFGTQWTQDKPDASGKSSRDDRPRRDGPGDGKRDRRGFKRPHGAPAGGGGPGDERRPEREFRERRDGPGGGGRDRPPHGGRREGGRPFRGPRREGGPGGGGFSRPPQERGPYISPYFTITFYPEDMSFTALAKTIRASCRTFELFDIAKTVIGKNDRFVVVVQRKSAETAPGATGGGSTAAAGEAARQPLYVSVPDGLLFDTEEGAVNHVLEHHLERFVEAAEVEVDPPKGNFQVINKCGVTGELLGPPNYHLYQQTVQQHHAARLSRMPFEVFRSRIETIRDPEVVNQWLERMKKVTRYTWKGDRAGAPTTTVAPASETPAPETPAPETPAHEAPASETPAPETPAQDAPAADSPATEAPAEAPVENTEEAAAPAPAPVAPAASGPVFDSLSEVRVYLLAHARDKVVRPVEHGRFHGRALEQLPDGEIKRAVEGALERQRRFPLDTANALRGRLRREGFTIFKKGSKGISYVCAVKRKFRVPGQTFADTIGQLISFIEANPMVKASELPQKLLGVESAPAETPLPIDVQQRLSRLQGDLRWLVTEGYVTEFIDGSLFAPPPMVEARKRELESGEGDTENFPDRPAAAAAPAAAQGNEAADETEAGQATAPVGEPADADKASETEAPVEGSATASEGAESAIEPVKSETEGAQPEPEAVRPAEASPPVQPEMPPPAEPAPAPVEPATASEPAPSEPAQSPEEEKPSS